MVVWTKVIYDHPEDHPRITKSEINYITTGRRDSAKIKVRLHLFGKMISKWVLGSILNPLIKRRFSSLRHR